MTSISVVQWNSMGRRSFESKMIAVIRQSHSLQSADVSDEAFSVEIRRQVLRAARCGLTDELAVATYVYTAWLLGLGFDERIPSLAQILGSVDLPPAVKVTALNDFTATVFHALDSAASLPAGQAR
jgi:hypothetical protein